MKCDMQECAGWQLLAALCAQLHATAVSRSLYQHVFAGPPACMGMLQPPHQCFSSAQFHMLQKYVLQLP